MAISAAQKTEIEAIIAAILNASTSRRRRHFADMFLELVDRESWPEYYDVSLVSFPTRVFVFQIVDKRG